MILPRVESGAPEGARWCIFVFYRYPSPMLQMSLRYSLTASRILMRAAAIPLAVGLAIAPDLRSYHFIAASHNLPDPPKAHRGGEDASFQSANALGTAGGHLRV